jgi:hypothetical protein
MVRRIALAGLVAGLMLAMQARAELPVWVRLSPLGQSAQAVPFTTVKTVADQRAKTMWSEARAGDVIPFADQDGNAIAYLFHYRIDGRGFPDYATAAAEAKTELRLLAQTGGHSCYAYVLASARYDRAPILNYGEGGTEFLITLEKARARARELLGAEPILTRVYFVWPLSYFEFEAQGKDVVLEAHTLSRSSTGSEFLNYVRSGEAAAAQLTGGDRPEKVRQCAAQMQAEWNRCLADSGAVDTVNTFVPNYELAPFYDWSYGCSPTSGIMVAGYDDIALGCGRCIYDFFQRWDCVEAQIDYQIPWAQREMALDFHTDTTSGGTYVSNIAPGLRTFGSAKGYTFTVNEFSGTYYNDWAWSSLTSEISSGYAMVWSVSWESHSLAAFGFRTPSKDVFVHNTWWWPGAWWHYTDGNSGSTAWIASVHPSGASPHRLWLTWPRGDTMYGGNGQGEILWVGQPNTVRWDNGGSPSDSLAIDLTTDGGWHWQNLAHGVPDLGSYTWNISSSAAACSTARLRLKAFAGGQYIAGDGSQGNFRMVRTPLPPVPLSPHPGGSVTVLPVVLLVDSMLFADTFHFVCYHTGETLWRQISPARACTMPDSLFLDRHPYNWLCQAHNSFGWGPFGGPWGFWIRLPTGIEETPAAVAYEELGVTSIARTQVRVRFQIPQPCRVRLDMFDAAGRPVRTLLDDLVAAGRHELVWDRRDDRLRPVAAGCYFVRLVSAGRSQVRKLQLVSSE